MMNQMQGMWNYWIFGIFGLLFLAIYVANDANQYGENGMLWGIVVLFVPMMGLLLYLVVRSGWTRQVQSTTNGSTHKTNPPRMEQVFSIDDTKETSTQSNKQNNRSYFCTSCGVENNPNATYCNNCGSKILG